MKKSVLILCTGNSCRSQMAEGFLRSFDTSLEVFSAGTKPADAVHPMAIKVMREEWVDISTHKPINVDEFLEKTFDYVISVCDGARESCPTFIGDVTHRLHIGFEDPAEATGTKEEILAVFRRVRDEINVRFRQFYNENLSVK
ncbi:arsenate reductase ArsC [Chlorobium sp. KB01]|uniref:arsenate reductase ArsC n=1 Tax=Chlorobium sp. KB01 TaxID=1917528 RepID=UPI0009765526|nr:arsenate reductase ArsC [Chlorobium sp. KB01]